MPVFHSPRRRSIRLALFIAPALAVGLLAFWLYLPAIAQPPTPAAGQEGHTLFTYDDGMATNGVTALLRDSRSLWVGTPAGLNRYSLRGSDAGLTWQTLTQDDGMAADAVSDLWSDDAGGLWVAHPTGQVSLMEDGAWTTYKDLTQTLELAYQQLVENEVDGPLWSLAEGGRVWALLEGTVGYYVGSVWRPYGADSGIPRGQLVAVWTGQDSTWVASENGQIGYFDKANWTTYNNVFDAIQRQYEVITATGSTAGPLWLVDQEGAVWVRNAFNQGNPRPDVRRFAAGRWTNFSDREGMATGFVAELRLDEYGRIWARHVADANGQGGGLSLHDGETWTAITPPLNGNVTDFWPEGSDGVWIGTLYQPESGGVPVGGLTYIALGTWRRFSLEALGGAAISDSWLDEEDELWLGLSSGARGQGGGLWRYNPGLDAEPAQWTPVEGLLDNDVRDLWGDGRGNLWIATASGVNRIALRSERRFTYTLPIQPDQISGDAEGNVWAVALGEEASSVWSWNGRTWISYTASNGLSGGAYADMLVATSGEVHLAGDRGLDTWNGTRWRTFAALPGRVVKRVWEDSAGDLWLTSEITPGRPFNLSLNQGRRWETVLKESGSRKMGPEPLAFLRDSRGQAWLGAPLGLFVYEPDGAAQWRGLGPVDGLPAGPVSALYEDPGGAVWIAIEDQVYRTDHQDWYRFAPQVGVVHHIAAGPDGSVLLAGDAGVALYHPTYPRLRLDGVVNLITGEVADGREPVVLTIGRNAIRIDLTTIEATLTARQLSYRYRLEGFDPSTGTREDTSIDPGEDALSSDQGDGWYTLPAHSLGGKHASITYAGLPAGVYTFTAAARTAALDYGPDVSFEVYVLSRPPQLLLDQAIVAGRPAAQPGALEAYVNQPILLQLSSEDDQLGASTYQYRIEGLGEGWSETISSEISFTLSSAGTYTFVARVLDEEGQPSTPVGSHIVIREREEAKPARQLPLQPIAIGLGVLAVLFIGIAIRLTLQRRRRESW